MSKIFISLGALLAALAVGLGAFGAHALKPMLTASQRLDTYETAVKYHFYHALGLLLLGLLLAQKPLAQWQWAGWLLLAGTVVFSGSLYVLCLTGIRWLGAVTPLGGVALIAGWLLVAWAAWRAQW